MRVYFALLTAALAVALAGCGGDDNGSSTPGPSQTPTGATLSPLEQKLASVILQASDLPEGLDAGTPDFATNEDLAAGDQTALQQLIQTGRQLGVDVQFIPTDRLDKNVPLRGGVESSASVYTTGDGASQTFRDTAEQARANDWQKNYPNIPDLKVSEVQQRIGDESLWLRLIGVAQCTFVVTPTPDASGNIPTQSCGDTKRLIIDNVVFRAGRVRGYLQVTTLFPPEAPDDSYVIQIKAWADLVTQRATSTFPG